MLLAAAYVAARVVVFLPAGTRTFRDTGGYESVADASVVSFWFVSGVFPPVVPFVLKVFGTGDAAFTFQLILSIGCWLALAASVVASLRHPVLRVAGFAAVLVFSLHRDVVQWDLLLLSESVAVSLTVAAVAAWLHAARRMTPRRVALAVVVTGAWVFARDPHAYVVLLVALGLAASALVWRGGELRLRLLAAAGLGAIALLSFVLASVNYVRWQYPVQNVMVVRIAADADDLRYFQDAGMPTDERFLRLAREYRASGDDPFLHPRDVERHPERPPGPFAAQRWLMDEGRRVYLRFLLTHPGYVARALGDLDHSLLDPDVDRYAPDPPPADVPVLPSVVQPPGIAGPLVLVVLALGAAGLAASRRLARREWAVPLAMMALPLPFALLIWHGEVLELDRHGLIGALSLRLGAVLLLLLAVDGLLSARAVKMRGE